METGATGRLSQRAPWMKNCWLSMVRQKQTGTRPKTAHPMENQVRFLSMGHAAFGQTLDLDCWQRDSEVTRVRITSCLHQSIRPHSIGRVFAVEQIVPMCATDSTYLHVLHTIFPQRKRRRNACFPREGCPWLWQRRGRRLPMLTNNVRTLAI